MSETSKTEQALCALFDTLEAALGAAGFPGLKRNETLDVLLEDIGEGTGSVVNLIDGNGDVPSETLGVDSGADGYEIEHNAEIEFLLSNADPQTCDATFDRGLLTIDDAIAADRTLGGVVDDCRLVPPLERSNPRTDGLAGVKYALVTVRLTFVSNRIF